MRTVRVLKNWDVPDLSRQSPAGDGVWGDLRFCFEDTEDEYDSLLVLNYPKERAEVRCPPSHTAVLIQEPFIFRNRDWICRSQKAFPRFFCHYFPHTVKNFIRSHPAVPWHVGKSYTDLIGVPPSEKTDQMSCISSNLQITAGHKLRYSFVRQLEKAIPAVDTYGRGFEYIPDKWDGLAPYRYSLAIENCVMPHYWTEKLADCFLAGTVPLYYGCPEIFQYFPEGSIIPLDIRDVRGSLAKIREILTEDRWEERLPALQKARDLVLTKYQFFPQMSSLLRDTGPVPEGPELLGMEPYVRHFSGRIADRVESWYHRRF